MSDLLPTSKHEAVAANLQGFTTTIVEQLSTLFYGAVTQEIEVKGGEVEDIQTGTVSDPNVVTQLVVVLKDGRKLTARMLWQNMGRQIHYVVDTKWSKG